MAVHDWTRVYAGLFHDFHQSWSIRIKDALNAGVLPKGLTALVEQKSRTEGVGRAGDRVAGRQCIRLTRTRHDHYATTEDAHCSQVHQRTVCRQSESGRRPAYVGPHCGGDRDPVSPGNKDSNRAFNEFLNKSSEFIRAGIHLLVVDLFPPYQSRPIWSGVARSGMSSRTRTTNSSFHPARTAFSLPTTRAKRRQHTSNQWRSAMNCPTCRYTWSRVSTFPCLWNRPT